MFNTARNSNFLHSEGHQPTSKAALASRIAAFGLFNLTKTLAARIQGNQENDTYEQRRAMKMIYLYICKHNEIKINQ